MNAAAPPLRQSAFSLLELLPEERGLGSKRFKEARF